MGCHNTVGVWRPTRHARLLLVNRRVAHVSAIWPFRSARAAFLQVVERDGPHMRDDEQKSIERWADDEEQILRDGAAPESAKMQRQVAAHTR